MDELRFYLFKKKKNKASGVYKNSVNSKSCISQIGPNFLFIYLEMQYAYEKGVANNKVTDRNGRIRCQKTLGIKAQILE